MLNAAVMDSEPLGRKVTMHLRNHHLETLKNGADAISRCTTGGSKSPQARGPII